MFDIGISEMAVIGVVALIVIGPEKLPKVARTVGILLGRAQRYVGDIKSDINRQIQLDELKRLQEQVESQARELGTSMKQELNSVESSLNETVQALTQSGQSAQSTPETPAPAPVETVELYRGEPEFDLKPTAPSAPSASPPSPIATATEAANEISAAPAEVVVKAAGAEAIKP